MVILESIEPVYQKHGDLFITIEWVITISVYALSMHCVFILLSNHLKYIFSFYGLVDLISILPSYLGLFYDRQRAFASGHSCTCVYCAYFRLLKLARYVNESRVLMNGLRRSMPKITVFIVAVFTLVIIIGTIMFMIEGSQYNSKFNSIPACMYWAIVTLSTVGYGDLTPVDCAW